MEAVKNMWLSRTIQGLKRNTITVMMGVVSDVYMTTLTMDGMCECGSNVALARCL